MKEETQRKQKITSSRTRYNDKSPIYTERGGKRSLFEDSLSPHLSVFCSFVTIQSFIFIVSFSSSLSLPLFSVFNETSDETKESINHELLNLYNKIEKPTNTYWWIKKSSFDPILMSKTNDKNRIKRPKKMSVNWFTQSNMVFFHISPSLIDIQLYDILLTIT